MALNAFQIPYPDLLFNKFEPATNLTETRFSRLLSLALFGGLGINHALNSFPDTYITNTSGSNIYCEFWNPIFTPFFCFGAGFGGTESSAYYYIQTGPTTTYRSNSSYNTKNLFSAQYPSKTYNLTTMLYMTAASYSNSFVTGRVRVRNSQTVWLKQIGTGTRFNPFFDQVNLFPTDGNKTLLTMITNLANIQPSSLSIPLAFEALKQKRPWIPILFETTVSTFYAPNYYSTANNTMSTTSDTRKLYFNGVQKVATGRPALTTFQMTKTTMIPWFRGLEGSYGSSIFVGLNCYSTYTISFLFVNNYLRAKINDEDFYFPLKATRLNSNYTQYTTTKCLVCEFDISDFLDRIYAKAMTFDNRKYIKISFPDFAGRTIHSLSIWRR